MNINIYNCEFMFPATTEPTWSKSVERWYQLDAYSYGLAELYIQIKEKLPHPNMIVLASVGASNETDFQFVRSGASSPSKFVHTLPSVRGAPLMELMGWAGEIICVQNDPKTWIDGLREALDLIQPNLGTIWVLQVASLSSGKYRATLAEVSYDASSEKKLPLSPQTALIASKNTIENSSSFCTATDVDFWNWLESQDEVTKLNGDFNLCESWVLKNPQTD